MTGQVSGCVICRGAAGDPELFRVQVWEDGLWRLSTSVRGVVAGFSYLEPKRHVPYVTDLDGAEAATFGAAIAGATRALKEETGAEIVFVYIFGGGIPHLHVHLAPHREGDALNSAMIRGELVLTKLPNGATAIDSKDFSPVPEAELYALAERVRGRLAGTTSAGG